MWYGQGVKVNLYSILNWALVGGACLGEKVRGNVRYVFFHYK